MAMQLQDLSDRPEMYHVVNNAENGGKLNGVIFTRTIPRVMISSPSRSGIPREISITVKDLPNKLHYAGSDLHGVYFYTKQARVLFEQNFRLFNIHYQGSNLWYDRETESTSVTFFHRQPYYLLRSGMITSSWMIKHFDEQREPIAVNLSGIFLDNALLIYKNQKLFILFKDTIELRERKDKNIVIIQDPDLDKECTAYTGLGNSLIYISLSTVAILMILNTETLAVEKIRLPRILDVRFAQNGELIFAEVQEQKSTRLSVLKLKDRYWKTTVNMEEDLSNALTELEVVRASEMAARQELRSAAVDQERADIAKEKQKKLGQDLAGANTKISQLKKQVASVQQELNTVKRESEKQSQRAIREKQNVTAKDKEHQRELQRVKQEAYAIAAQRLVSENGMVSMREERDNLAEQLSELEKKYRRMLMLVGRQPLFKPISSSARADGSLSTIFTTQTNTILDLASSLAADHQMNTEKDDNRFSSLLKQTKKKNKNERRKAVREQLAKGN
ncbi:hypothetical protein PENTCL1PPCAC_10553 [Pristionchus entomophagus]|uniref:Uncharacterized protein n=1 Tax=Pristionchus entomophagus TaxID=358040 RepID=A0AAV5T6C9_9BILA|nr:hypothetical protein PENTCL1PPCAC_10553 [Pristionchus entomophagus]